MPIAWIETARLRLRPCRRSDLDELHALFTDPGVRRYLLDDTVVSRDWVAAEITSSLESFADSGIGQWAILPAGGDELIGFTGYRRFHAPELELYYGLASSHWNRGLATEAARAMIRLGFEHHGFPSILASTDAPNAASARVLEKAGFRFEKRTRVAGLDTLIYRLDLCDFDLGTRRRNRPEPEWTLQRRSRHRSQSESGFQLARVTVPSPSRF